MQSHLESEPLRTFVAIAETGSFTAAGDVVHRTQSAVSMQIKKLEAGIGRPLFRREARGVVLTPTGEALLGKARQALALLDEAAASLQGPGLEGHLRIGIPEEYGARQLPDLLARFAEAHPGVQVTVRCEWTPGLSAALDRGELDLAVLVADQGGVTGDLLVHDPTVWATSLRHATHEADPLPIALYESGCWWRDWALRLLDRAGRRYRIAYTSESVAGIQAAVVSGLAVGVLGTSTLPSGARALREAEGFVELPGSHILLRRAKGSAGPAVTSMAQAITEAFRKPKS